MNEYKRLTRQNAKGEWVANAGHYGVYLDPETHADMIYGDIVNRLAELENTTEKTGRYNFPVGINDYVYYVYHDGGYTELKICGIAFSKLGCGVSFFGISASNSSEEFMLSDFGVCVFLTEEEAQKKSEEWSR